MAKCTMCFDRIKEGMLPACVKTCPTGALQFGERNELIQQGKARVNALKATYPDARLYGEKELGGLHVMYVLIDAPSVHGLPETPKFGTYTEFDETAFPGWYKEAVASGKLPAFPEGADPAWYLQSPGAVAPGGKNTLLWSLVGLGVVAVGAGLWWTLRRRMARQTEKTKT